jgi:hypothetical protein
VLAFAVLTLGCGSEADPTEEPPVTSSPSSSPSGPAADAVADLATRLDVDAASIEVVAEEAVTWHDGSLGCAQPGFSYTQALVEGSRITLQVEGTDYEYHSARKTPAFWCEKPTQ